ncbi:hypothetical protein GCM10027176_76140 [Actinoallomurus bryophytorum]|uniref:Uncharacterized protein n=1 Tax=Actinoallomurus bryophytorum TaxID=1490222 RepID=A0A543C185_9ACTN|nr:hypothetical protein [Actinoallomurus bryophytorum]TQL90845.1 hypothetical protein FB559_8159 [Actinoallomurus bryophytorum]
MNANTVIAVCATVIALGSLWISYTQARATESHNRQTVRPLLKIRRIKNYANQETGLQIINAGLGPAIITESVVSLDGKIIGQWNLDTYHKVVAVAALPIEPYVYTAFSGTTILVGQTSFLLHLDDYVDEEHDWFWKLISQRIDIEIHYESLYGGEDYRVELPPLS